MRATKLTRSILLGFNRDSAVRLQLNRIERRRPHSFFISRRSLLAAAAAALLLAGPSLAHAQNLSVDALAYGNSPYTFSASATYTFVIVGVVSTGVLNHSAGTLTDTDTFWVGRGGGTTGTYNLSGTGVLSAVSSFIGGGNDANSTGNGFFNQSGGSHTVSGNEYIGYSPGGSNGTYTQSGGTHTINGVLTLGNAGNGVSGTYTLTAGTLAAATENLGGPGGQGSFTQSGGTNTVTGALQIGRDNGGNETSPFSTYNLNGGTLAVSQVIGVDSLIGVIFPVPCSYSAFNFNGGTLQARANSASFFGNINKANVQAGGAKINTNGFGVTVAQALLHDPNAPAMDGGLTKSGAGTLTLSATSTYTGATTVSGGTLAISGRLTATSGIVLNSGGTLSLSGSTAVTDRFYDAAAVSIKGGGTFATGGFDEGTAPTAPGGAGGAAGLGALTFSTTTSIARATIDFANTATGSTLVFSSRTAASSGAFVRVLNWTGTPGVDGGSPTNDRLLFQTDPGFTAADLANVQFSNDSGVNYASGAVLINYNGYYELVPSPPHQAPAITSVNATTFTVGSAGTFTVTTIGVPTPTVTQTGTLPNGVTFDSATSTLSGTPAAGTGGTYPITFTASNGVGSNAVQSFTLTVNQPPAITSANAATFVVGTAGSFTVTTTGFPNPTVSQTGTLPSGITFNAATKSLSGTPAAGTGGTYSISFAASNGIGSNAAQNFTLTVNQAPSISSTSGAVFTEGNFRSFPVTASGYPAPTFSATGTLPSGVTFAPSGMLSGTPAAGTAGNYPLQITATNGIGSNDVESFTLVVVGPVCVAPPADLVAWYPGEGNAIDVKSGNNGVALNGAAYANAKAGQGFTFNGSTSVIEVPNAPAWNFGANNFTVQTWVNFAALSGSDVLVGRSQGTGAVNKWLFSLKSGKLEFHLNGSAVANITSDANFTPVLRWYHVAVTRSGNIYKFYVDGVQNGTDRFDGNSVPVANAPLTLGKAEAFPAMNGSLDEVQIFSRALTPAEIQSVYNASTEGFCVDAPATASAVSRKIHGAAGTFDINLPLTGQPGVECRSGSQTIVVSFNNTVTEGSVAVSAGSVSGTPTFSGNTMTINLASVPNAQRVTLTLTNVKDAFAQVLPNASILMNVLLGDTNGSGGVSATDIGQTKAASGQAVGASNFRQDVNVSGGSINASDIGLVKSRSGTQLPP